DTDSGFDQFVLIRALLRGDPRPLAIRKDPAGARPFVAVEDGVHGDARAQPERFALGVFAARVPIPDIQGLLISGGREYVEQIRHGFALVVGHDGIPFRVPGYRIGLRAFAFPSVRLNGSGRARTWASGGRGPALAMGPDEGRREQVLHGGDGN